LQRCGFHFNVVLADSLYGENSDFVGTLEQLHLKYVVAIRSNHGVWLPPGQRVRYTNWRPFERGFSNGKQQTRSIREIVLGSAGASAIIWNSSAFVEIQNNRAHPSIVHKQPG
jgi:SRSO17 transposase